MTNFLDIEVAPDHVNDKLHIELQIRKALNLRADDPIFFRVVKRSLDARKKIVYRLRLEISTEQEIETGLQIPEYHTSFISTVHIIGAGPAGLFAALKCLEKGFRPIVIERGKDVRARRRDLAVLNKQHIVDRESNYCFGEGGAGAYSDGKLYTRSKKRGNVKSVLETLVMHGADEDILVDAHPHIGTNKLPGIITRIRETIVDKGGEVRFESKLTDINIQDSKIRSIVINHEEELEVDNLILATGHSARDIFELCKNRRVAIEAKPFALGVRVEHPQALINKMQYGRSADKDVLPPAAYSMVCQVNDTGVFSFCMCPGGIIAPCATAPGEIVTNGWSPSKRNNPFANSGIVVEVKDEDLRPYAEHGALAGVEFQSSVEKRAWKAGGMSQVAPAQRLVDFIMGRASVDLPDCSYFPGVRSVELAQVLPARIYKSLQEGFKQFGVKMNTYLTNEAIVVATESRSSSPVRIPRDKKSLEHIEIKGLYPCGEGAGYAGGIVSAAIDGQRCVEAIALKKGQLSN
ncbi:MAG: FAD-binding protein [Flavobacteriales bacterium]|nr:FAD-binding protein [Flavobacteriales bacterium]